MSQFSGRKASSGGGGSGSSAPDTLFSDDVVELILGLSEGPIVGLDNGARSFLVADTPLVDTSGVPNLGKFDLRIHPGLHPADKIVPRLGGSGASTSVGVQLETNTPVVRSGSHTQLDYIEVRIAVQRLLQVNDKGDGPATVSFRIELKAQSSSVWGNAFSGLPPLSSEQLGTAFRYTSAGQSVGSQVNPAYHETYIQTSAPGAPVDPTANPFWFDSDDSYRPYFWELASNSWTAVVGAVQNVVAAPGYSFWAWGNRRAYYGSTGTATPPAGLGLYDFWIAPPGTPTNTGVTPGAVSFVWNGSAWVDYMDWAAPPTSGGGDITVSGKATSTYVKEIRIPVPRINEPYSVRVTKLSPLNTTKYFADITFESFQEISAQPLQFDDLAVAHLTIKASDQFSSVPDFTGVYRGRLLQVPSNYDPVSKVYSPPIWDGTFKIAYSNNPAWVAYDLVNNDRYGMAAYYQATLDKYAVYAFAKHCDAHGFTYNDWMSDPRNLSEAIDYICGIAGGRFVDPGDGFATILFDADDQPAVHLFTPENVIDGVFSYAFTDITSRKNDITVSYVNENYNWVEDRRRVFDADHIAKYGRNPEEFVAVGCIDETEAVKRARLRLAVSLGEKAVVSFRTNRQGLYVQPYSIVLVGDPDSGFGISGRIKRVVDATHIEVRDPIYFEAGLPYAIEFSHVGAAGLEILTYDLVTTVGSTTILTLATSLTEALTANCNFAISTSGSTGAPKAYRITNIEEVDGEPDNVSLTGIEVNRNKWAFVDGLYVPPNVIQTGQVSSNTLPVSNVRVEGQTTSDGIHNILMAWDASPSPLTRYNRIYVQMNGGSIQVLTETRDTRYTLAGAQPASYTFTIVAVSMDGQESPPVTFQHEVLGALRPVSPPMNFRLLDGVDPNTFRTRNPAFAWDESNDPFFSTYRLRIYNQSTGVVMRTVDTQITSYVYDFATNTADFGTPSRTFRMELRAVDKAGSESQPLVLLVSNPQIAPPATIGLTTRFYGLFIDAPRPTDRDYSGTVIYASTTANFTPGPGNLIYDGPDCSFRTTIGDGETKYVRVGHYDDFSNTTTLSNQFSSVGAGLDPGTVSYDKLTAELQTIIDTAGDPTDQIAAAITAEANIRQSGDTALGQKIDTVAATAGGISAFDPVFVANFDSGLEGFLAANATTAVTNGLVSYTASATDHWFQTPVIAINGGIYNRIRIRARRTAGTAETVYIYYETAGHGWHGGYFKTQTFSPLPALNEWFLVDVDMWALDAGGADWKNNTITRVRIDLADAASTAFEIDWVAIGRYGPASSALVQQQSTALADLAGNVYGQWTVKIQTQQVVGGTTKKVVSGFGLAQAGGNGETTSDFVIQADRFLVTPTYDPSNPIPIKPVFAVGTVNGVAEVGINGNMFIDGSITARTLNVVQLSAVSSDMGTMTAGKAQSADLKFVINFTGGYLVVSE